MSNRLKYADLSFSRKLSSSPLSVQGVHQFVPQAAQEDDGDGQHEQTRHLAQQRQREHLLRLVREDLARAVLLRTRTDAKTAVLLLTDSAVTEPTNVDEEAVALEEAFAGRGEAGETPAGSMDAAANGAAPPTAVAASVFAGPRRGRTRVSSDEARFGRRSVSVGPSPLVRSARIEVGFQGSAPSSASPASADARHDTRTARRPFWAARHARHDAGAADRVGGLTNNRRGDERASRSGRARGRDRARSGTAGECHGSACGLCERGGEVRHARAEQR